MCFSILKKLVHKKYFMVKGKVKLFKKTIFLKEELIFFNFEIYFIFKIKIKL